jgi:amino acid transporter
MIIMIIIIIIIIIMIIIIIIIIIIIMAALRWKLGRGEEKRREEKRLRLWRKKSIQGRRERLL